MRFRTDVDRTAVALMQARMFWRFKQGVAAWAFWTIALFAFLAWFKGMPKTPTLAFKLLGASAGGAVGSLVVIWLISIVQAYFGSTARAGIIGPHEFEIRDDGLFERTGANETLTKWAAIKNVTRHGAYIYVEIGRGLFHIIPRSSFATDADSNACYEALKSRMGNGTRG